MPKEFCRLLPDLSKKNTYKAFTDKKTVMENNKISAKRIRKLTEKIPLEGLSGNRVFASRNFLPVSDIMINDVATMSVHETVFSAAKNMFEKRVSCIIVRDGDQIAGILTETDFLKRIAARKREFTRIAIASLMTSPVISISPDTSVLRAGAIAEKNRIKKLPVIDNGKLVGIVTQTDLIRVLTYYGMWRDIEEIMSAHVITITADATVVDAAEVMTNNKISCVVVIDDKNVIGILTERDVLKRVVAAQKDPETTKINDVMSAPVKSVPPDYSVFSASRLIENINIRRLVIMEGNTLKGIVTQTDIFRAVKNKLQNEENEFNELMQKI